MSDSCNPMDCSPPGSSVHGSLQPRALEWVAMPFSRGSLGPRDRTWVSCIGKQILYRLHHQESPTINPHFQRDTFFFLGGGTLHPYRDRGVACWRQENTRCTSIKISAFPLTDSGGCLISSAADCLRDVLCTSVQPDKTRSIKKPATLPSTTRHWHTSLFQNEPLLFSYVFVIICDFGTSQKNQEAIQQRTGFKPGHINV